jgi:hypothetical protein
MHCEARLKHCLGVIVFCIAVSGCSGKSTPAAPSPTSGATVQPTVISVTVSGTTPFVGATAQFIATAVLSNGTSPVITGQATWSSSNTAVASVRSSGLITGIGLGEADITALYQSVSGTIHVAVVEPVTPGGLATGQYQFSLPALDDMDFFFTVEADPGTQPTFWAHQFYFVNGSSDDLGYLGLQTRGISLGREVGRMAIFSIWNALDAVAAPGAAAEPFGNEGVGYSLRLPYAYQQGTTYRFRVSRDAGGWWAVAVRDMSNGAEVTMGRILGKPTWGQLKAVTVNFTEVYSRIAGCSALAYARVRFDPPAANSGTVQARLTNRFTYGPCAAFARTIAVGSTLAHEIGTTNQPP